MWIIMEIHEEEFVEVQLDEGEWDVEDLSEESKNEQNSEKSNGESSNDKSSNDESNEESNDEALNERFSVAAAPLKWVHMRKKILCCYWPKTDAAIKIRSGEVPKGRNDENWTVHICRILMNGEKFESYKSAREAEKIAENCSTMTEYRDRFGRKRQNQNDSIDSENKIIKNVVDAQSEYLVCNSTMHFDVESDLEETSSSDTDDNILYGNDTYKYNEVIKYKGEYLQNDAMGPNEDFERYTSSPNTDEEFSLEKSTTDKKPLKPDTKDNNVMKNNQDETFVINKNHSYSVKEAAECDGESEESERRDYNLFKFTSDEMLTSTRIEEDKEMKESTKQSKENSRINANCAQQNIFTRVAKIELMVSTFNSNIQDELRQLKECTKLVTNEQPVSIPILNVNDTVSMSEKHFPNTSTKTENKNVQGLNDKSVQRLILKVPDPISIENNVDAASSKIEILNVQELNAPVHSDEFKIDVSSAVPANTALDSVIELPIMDKPHFEKNDASVEQDTFEDALVEWLLPLEDEQEAKYMDRVVDTLFNEKFFVDCITWKIGEKDPKRVLLRFTSILKCWKRSYETKFPPDDKENTKFMAHCRRIKGKKRAAKKAKMQVAK